jgi:hypothetical protein
MTEKTILTHGSGFKKPPLHPPPEWFGTAQLIGIDSPMQQVVADKYDSSKTCLSTK